MLSHYYEVIVDLLSHNYDYDIMGIFHIYR